MSVKFHFPAIVNTTSRMIGKPNRLEWSEGFLLGYIDLSHT